MWKWTLRPRAELKRCTNVTAPHCGCFSPSDSWARRRNRPNTLRTKMFKMSDKFRIVGHAITELERKRKHSLANGNPWKDAIDEVGSGIGHFPPSTTRTPTATFAGIRNNAVVTTRVAMQAKEAMFRDTAGQTVP